MDGHEHKLSQTPFLSPLRCTVMAPVSAVFLGMPFGEGEHELCVGASQARREPQRGALVMSSRTSREPPTITNTPLRIPAGVQGGE